MSVDLLNKEISPIFFRMEDSDDSSDLACYFVGSICQRLYDLPIYRLAFLYDMIFSYCDSSCVIPEVELSNLLKESALDAE